MQSQSGSVGWGLRARFAAAFATALVMFAPLAAAEDRKAACAEEFDHAHCAWSAILQEYVSRGNVDYAGLKSRGASALDAYLKKLEAVCESDYAKWSRDQRLAYWINAYNAYTVRLILNHHPLESIRSIGVLPGAAFRKTFIPLDSLRGRTLSLNDIEHEILRKEFKEPRIHFALVCASKGCPPLPSKAFQAGTLGKQLEAATRSFLADEKKNRFDPADRTLRLSPIFKWFREDFERDGSNLVEFVAKHSDPETARALRRGEIEVEFGDYDWSLNGR